MVKFLIKNGIKSISVNADAAYEVSKLVSKLESPHQQEKKEDYSQNNRNHNSNNFQKQKNENKNEEKDYLNLDTGSKEYVEIENEEAPINNENKENTEKNVLDEIPELPQISDEELKDRELLNEINSETQDKDNQEKRVPNYVADDVIEESPDEETKFEENNENNKDEELKEKENKNDDIEELKEINEEDMDEILDIF